MSPGPPNGGHLTDKSLVAYVERHLSDEECERLEGHLADCHQCRKGLLAATDTLRGERRRKTARAAAGGAVGIGAVMGLILFGPLQPRSDVPRVRSGPSSTMDEDRVLRVVSPSNGETVLADSILFSIVGS